MPRSTSVIESFSGFPPSLAAWVAISILRAAINSAARCKISMRRGLDNHWLRSRNRPWAMLNACSTSASVETAT
ncbi:hypothetical protein D3C71_1764300 [compost metagenome]